MEVKAGESGQEEWNLAATELELISNPTPLLGKKGNGEGGMMISARARKASEPNGHEEMAQQSQILPAPRGLGSVPTILAWGSGVHRKLEEGEGRGELERVSATEKIKRFKGLFPSGKINSSLIRTQTRDSLSWCMV